MQGRVGEGLWKFEEMSREKGGPGEMGGGLLRAGSLGLGAAHPTEQGPAPRLQLLPLLASCFLRRLLVLSARSPAVATVLGGACTLYPSPRSRHRECQEFLPM